jgi:hypothetical protein
MQSIQKFKTYRYVKNYLFYFWIFFNESVDGRSWHSVRPFSLGRLIKCNSRVRSALYPWWHGITRRPRGSPLCLTVIARCSPGWKSSSVGRSQSVGGDCLCIYGWCRWTWHGSLDSGIQARYLSTRHVVNLEELLCKQCVRSIQSRPQIFIPLAPQISGNG